MADQRPVAVDARDPPTEIGWQVGDAERTAGAVDLAEDVLPRRGLEQVRDGVRR